MICSEKEILNKAIDDLPQNYKKLRNKYPKQGILARLTLLYAVDDDSAVLEHLKFIDKLEEKNIILSDQIVNRKVNTLIYNKYLDNKEKL